MRSQLHKIIIYPTFTFWKECINTYYLKIEVRHQKILHKLQLSAQIKDFQTNIYKLQNKF